jgi:hypothetical protein
MQPVPAESSRTSFEEVRARLYAEPSPPDRLPQYEGASRWETIRAIFLSSVSDRITCSMNRTLADAGDVKDGATKLFHPKGVCAEAQWEVFAGSVYTGLFAAGTRARAIVRMSASGNNTRFNPAFLAIPLLAEPRSFGLAVKLFPAADSNRKVATCNLLLFDHTGLDGNPSPWYMRGVSQKNGQFGEQYFLNWMHGSGLVTSGFARLFSRFATDVRHRPVDPLGKVTADGEPVSNPKSPRFIRLIPGARYPADEKAATWEDFRLEILDLARLGALTFDIAVSEANPVESAPPRQETTIGRLTLGVPVVSEFGDRQLHFTHRM